MAEPTRNAAEPPLASGYCDNIDLPPVTLEPPRHKCPYGGWTAFAATGMLDCGEHGTLCDRCQQDRSDRRTRALVRATLWQLSNVSIRMDAKDIESLSQSILSGEELA